jgi:hypothetical protein
MVRILARMTSVLPAAADPDAAVSDIRFAAAGAHWAAAFSCLDVASVLTEATGRAERMARYGLSRTTPVRLHDLGRPAAVLSRSQWALACAIDGAASAQDLAWRCGLALYEAIENIGQLIAAGLCLSEEADVAAAPASPLAEWFEPVPPQAGLPRRAHPAPMLPAPVLSTPPVMAAEARAAGGIPVGLEFTPAPQDLLRRVLDGLRRNT